jgi:hypothetical protein
VAALFPICACGSAEIFALRPGVEPLRLDAIDLFTRRDKATEAGVADAAWCLACWSKRYGRRAA